MTIFAMPKPFEGHLATIQKNAIRSWTRLRPAPEIILIGDEAGTWEMAEDVGARHIPEIRRNEFGTPLVDYIFQAAQEHASHAIMAYVNADMILFQSFAAGVRKVQADLSKFLLIGQRWDLPIFDEIDFDHGLLANDIHCLSQIHKRSFANRAPGDPSFHHDFRVGRYFDVVGYTFDKWCG